VALATSGRSGTGSSPLETASNLRSLSTTVDPAAVILRAYPEAGAELAQAIAEVAADLGASPYMLADLIYHESGHTFSPSVRGPGSLRAVGLIQFIPRTAERLGTTQDALAAMAAPDQCRQYVREYLRRVRDGEWPDDPKPGRLDTLQGLTMSVFYPKAREPWPPDKAFPTSIHAEVQQSASPRIYMDAIARGRLGSLYKGSA
jgi:AraC-like DNA-binding protein